MAALLLYLVTTIGLIACWRRFVQPMSRTAAIVLVLLPLCFTGRALLTGTAKLDLTTIQADNPDDNLFTVPQGYTRVDSIAGVLRR